MVSPESGREGGRKREGEAARERERKRERERGGADWTVDRDLSVEYRSWMICDSDQLRLKKRAEGREGGGRGGERETARARERERASERASERQRGLWAGCWDSELEAWRMDETSHAFQPRRCKPQRKRGGREGGHRFRRKATSAMRGARPAAAATRVSPSCGIQNSNSKVVKVHI